MKLATIAFVVREYDEAIAWFVDVLGFVLVEDTALDAGKRWVRVAAPGGETCLLLARAANARQSAAIGNAAGGRVGHFLEVDDFEAHHRRLAERGVRFRAAPRDEAYGRVAVFEDLYGNGWDLIGPTTEKIGRKVSLPAQWCSQEEPGLG